MVCFFKSIDRGKGDGTTLNDFSDSAGRLKGFHNDRWLRPDFVVHCSIGLHPRRNMRPRAELDLPPERFLRGLSVRIR